MITTIVLYIIVICGLVYIYINNKLEEDNNSIRSRKNIFSKGSLITLKQGERHRLIGLNDFGVIAEIWQHTDVNNPSDENDIVRIQDDYGR